MMFGLVHSRYICAVRSRRRALLMAVHDLFQQWTHAPSLTSTSTSAFTTAISDNTASTTSAGAANTDGPDDTGAVEDVVALALMEQLDRFTAKPPASGA